jgi:hypothetical protein
MVELGAANSAPLRLTERQFATLSEHLPGQIQALCPDEYYISDVHDNFRVVTGGSYRTAWFHLGLSKNKKEIALELRELLYLKNILYLVANQVGRYSEAMVNVMNYSTAVMASSKFFRTTAPLHQADSVPSIV